MAPEQPGSLAQIAPEYLERLLARELASVPRNRAEKRRAQFGKGVPGREGRSHAKRFAKHRSEVERRQRRAAGLRKTVARLRGEADLACATRMAERAALARIELLKNEERAKAHAERTDAQ